LVKGLLGPSGADDVGKLSSGIVALAFLAPLAGEEET
jgi:hypothetical protein